MRKIDQWIIDAVQRTYLWIFDRTGVYAGTLLFALGVTANAVYGIDATRIVLMGVWGICCAFRYWMQDTDETRYNALAESDRTFIGRYLCVFLGVVNLAASVITMNALEMIGEIAFLSWVYLMCAKVRRREPPERRSLAVGANR